MSAILKKTRRLVIGILALTLVAAGALVLTPKAKAQDQGSSLHDHAVYENTVGLI